MNNKVLTFLYFLLISSICWSNANVEGLNKNYLQTKSYHPDLFHKNFGNYLSGFYFVNDYLLDSIDNELLNDVLLFEGDYCIPTTSNTGDHLSAISTANAVQNVNYTTTSSPAGNYSDNSTQLVQQAQGISFNISTTYVGGSNGVNVWIDWNDDGLFDDTNGSVEKVFSLANSDATKTGIIVVPIDAPLGEYRMRVRGQYGTTANPGPCGEVTWGSTVDFTLKVLAAPDCIPPTALNAEALSLTSVELSWTSDGDDFEVEWGEVGFTQGEGSLIGNLATNSTIVTTVTDTPYQFYVRRNCNEDGFSFWSGPFNFETGYCLPIYTNGCSNGAKVSNFETSNAILNIANNTGTSSCGVNGYNSFTDLIVAAPENMTISYSITVGSYSGGVKIWIDWNGNGTFEDGELIGQSTSTITSGSNFTGTFEVPTGTALGDYRMRVRVVEGSTNFGACTSQSYGEVEDYTFSVIETPSCMPPSNLTIIQVMAESVEIGWTATAGQDTWQILVLPSDSPAPTENATGFEVATVNPYIIDGLNTETKYDIYVRSDCGEEDGVSYWTGPIKTKTTQVPATLPYEEGFEGANNWSFTEGATTNQWVIGTAVNNGGINSLYVSKDGGTTHTYDTSGTTVVHAYRDFLVEGVSGELEVGFDRLCNGEGFSSTKHDYLNVWLVPSSYSPIAGTLIENTTNSGGFKIVDKYNGNAEAFLSEDFVVNLNGLNPSFNSGYFRIVLEWRQDSSTGNQPPAAIDNLRIKKVTCPRVIDLQSEILDGGDSVKLTWTPTGTETQWEVFIVEFDDETIPDENTTGIIVNAPQYIYTEGVADQFYKFFVRPICSEDDKGRWSDTGIISFIPPPGCAVVEADIEFSDLEGLEPNEKGDYIICQDEPVNLKFGSSYYDIPGTNEYDVEQIEYRPPFPFTGGGAIALTIDDRWSETVELGFNFCFFGNSFDKVLIGTNGAITFSIKDEVEGGRYTPDTGSGYSYNQQLPFSAGPTSTSPPYVNAIFGVMQDLNPEGDNSPNDYSVNYQVIGKAPCRTLVFNIYHLGLFSCGYDPEDVEGSTQTSQIVLYEGTNMIEVYVKNRPSCPGFNSGSGVIGIQNADGTIAYTPPGRNTGAWTATEEAWRFSPSGESSVFFEWEKDGEFYSSEPEIEVSVTESVRYTARATYQICGEDFSLFKEFNFLKEDFAINGIEDLIDCSRKPGELNVFELRTNDSLVLGDLDPERYTIEYFFDESDAHNGENALPDVFETLVGGTAYVKLTNLTTGCYKLRPFRLVISDPVVVTKVEDAWVCESFEFPTLKPGEAFYTKPYGEGERYEAGDVYSKLGDRKFYVYRVNEFGCYGQSSFDLEIVGAPVADIIEDQLLKCETYFLPLPSENNKYFTEPGGQGVELPAKLEIRKPMTIYIYAKIVGTTGRSCVDESSFKVDFEDCPLPKGISPNGDGLNDSFDLTGYGILDIKIYNRYGTEVFSYGETYTNEWHGQDKAGQALPDGTYYYVAIANGKVRTGWVQINR